MSTPKRPNGGHDGTSRTPFRERALEEQRLREEFLLRSTPGWKSSGQTRNDTVLPKDPLELSTYLRELSTVLLEQKDRDEQFHESRKQHHQSLPPESRDNVFGARDIQITESGIQPDEWKEDDEEGIGSNEPPPKASLSREIFSSLADNRVRKVRKTNDGVELVILDTSNRPSELDSKTQNFDRNVPPQGDKSDLSFLNNEDDNEFPEVVASEQIIDNGQKESSSPVEEMGDSPYDHETSGNFFIEKNVKPIRLSQLRHLVTPVINEDVFSLSNDSLRMLQQVSTEFIEKLSQDLKSLVARDTITLNRSLIITLLQKYNIVSDTPSNQELFELCCEYLPLEELNVLEIALFGGS